MARVITYTPTALTNFSDGNAMFNGAIQNMNQAFKTGIDTANTFGQNVRDRNQAVLDSIINGISQEDLAKPDTQLMLSNVIRDMEHNSAGMIDLGKAFGAIDKRGSVLVDRNNAQLENQENQIKAQNMQDNKSASELVALDRVVKNTTPDSKEFDSIVAQYTDMYNKANPNVRMFAEGMVKQNTLDDIQFGINRNNANYNLRSSTEQFNTNIVNAMATQQVEFENILNNPNSTVEQKEVARQGLINIANVGKQLGVSLDTYTSAYSKANESAKTLVRQAQKDATEQANKDRDYNLKEYVATNTVRQGDDKNALDTYQTVYGGKSGSDSNSSSSESSKYDKPLNDLEKEMFAKGYTKDVINGKAINPEKVVSLLHSDMSTYRQNLKATRDNVNYAQWATTEAASLEKTEEAHKNGEGIFSKKGKDFLEHLKVANIPDWQKVAIHTKFKNGGFTFDEWLKFGDSVDAVVKKEAELLNQDPDSVIRNDYQKRGRDTLNKLTQLSGMSSAELLTRLYAVGSLPDDVMNVFSKEDQARALQGRRQVVASNADSVEETLKKVGKEAGKLSKQNEQIAELQKKLKKLKGN